MIKDINKADLIGKRILSIDYGIKRIGIAVCDELHISCNPVKTIYTDKENYKEEIKRLIKSERASAVVIGLPRTKDGKENEIHNKIKHFADYIRKEMPIDVYYFDESYSSQFASEYMIEYGIKKKDRAKKGTIDKFAAVIILQQFLSELE